MQLVVLSGKGGTGKTTIAAALARLAECPLAVDCDVDAANLHLLLELKDLRRQPFSGGQLAELQPDRCQRCNLCGQVCRFQAVQSGQVDPWRCEGCGACVHGCPEQALRLREQVTGQVILTGTEWGWLSRAELRPAASGSGRLVTAVRGQSWEVAETDDLVILDGSPGLGCPVMASLTGCTAALVVLEPTRSSRHDFQRLLGLLRRFGLQTYACINRYDLSPELTAELRESCQAEGIPLLGLIPDDPQVLIANRRLRCIVSYADSPAAVAIRRLWSELSEKIGVTQ